MRDERRVRSFFMFVDLGVFANQEGFAVHAGLRRSGESQTSVSLMCHSDLLLIFKALLCNLCFPLDEESLKKRPKKVKN